MVCDSLVGWSLRTASKFNLLVYIPLWYIAFGTLFFVHLRTTSECNWSQMGPLELFGLDMHRPRRNFNVLVSKCDCFICGLDLISGPLGLC